MRNAKRISALLLAMVLALSIFSSCGIITGGNQDPQELAKSAEEYLDTHSYIANTRIEYSSSDVDMMTILTTLGNSEISLQFDGMNTFCRVNTSVGSMTLDTKYTLCGTLLYQSMELTNGESTAVVNRRAVLGEAEQSALITDIGAGASVSADDFATATADATSAVGGEYKISCNSMKPGSVDGLTEISKSKLPDGAAVTVDNVQYSASVKDGKYTSEMLVYDMIIDIDGKNYSISVKMSTEYTYGESVIILPPANWTDYNEVTYEQMLGIKS